MLDNGSEIDFKDFKGKEAAKSNANQDQGICEHDAGRASEQMKRLKQQLREQKALNVELIKREADKNQVIFELQEEAFALREEKTEMAKALETLSLSQQKPVAHHKRNNGQDEQLKDFERKLQKVPSQKDLALNKKSSANLPSPSVVLKAGNGSMSEKMSFYLNLSASQDSIADQTLALRNHAFGAERQASDAEKARLGSMSVSQSQKHLPNQPMQTRFDEIELEETKRQNEQLIEDVNMLVRQNIELKSLLQALQDEITYLKLREKKIMYLVHLLQGKGYPVTQIFEKQVKPINTLRFDEFLHGEEKRQQQEADLDRQAMNEFSFASDASYEPLVLGPALQRKRPAEVPALQLTGLPEYVTTSEEEEGEGEGEGDAEEWDSAN